jgi:hypothetical protein
VKRADLVRAADPAGYADGLAATTPPAEGGHAHPTVRTDTYAGHSIVVRTTYEVEVDGRPVTAAMHVDHDGNVSCHALPVYKTASIMEVVRLLIDVFPEDFPKPPGRPRRPKRPGGGSQEGHGGHGEGGDGGHPDGGDGDGHAHHGTGAGH